MPSLLPRRHQSFQLHRPAPPLPLRLAADCCLIDMLGESRPSSLRRNLLFFFVSIFILVFVYCLILFGVDDRSPLSLGRAAVLPRVFRSSTVEDFEKGEEYRLRKVLKAASMKDGTVILTTLNDAWSAPDSVFELFLESFRIGDGTSELLKHLVIVALDAKAFERCRAVHAHCFALVTEGVNFSSEAYFMTAGYLKMMWRRIDFLRSVLEMGYNFVFTDADIMWFRDPFSQFFSDVDLQIACDHFTGDSEDMDNRPNGGFNYVRSNNRSIEFYKFWYSSRESYPGYHDQDVFNFIKYDPFLIDIGLRIRFLDTTYFGGFCERSEDINQVCTMHANCCLGLDSKLHDLRILLRDWKRYSSLPPSLKRSLVNPWRVPENCSIAALLRSEGPSPVNNTQLEYEVLQE